MAAVVARAAVVVLTLATGLAMLAGCGGHRAGAAGAEGGAADASADLSIASARHLASGAAPLPVRAEALALAQSIEARALREGAGARAAELHAAAAQLLERVWRTEGKEQDAREAVELYRAAARQPELPGACDAALAVARLAGEVAHDASTTYAELYRAERRFAGVQSAAATGDAGAPGAGGAGGATPSPSLAACLRAIEDGLDLLVAFRPPQRVLEAIDEGLAGEGAIGQSLAAYDAGPLVAVKPPQVMRIESWPGRDASRVVIVLDRPAPYRVGDEVQAGGGPRTFVELDGVDLGSAPREQPLDGVIGRVHAEPTSTGSRVTLDLQGPVFRRVFYLPEPYRIVVDIARHPPGVTGRSGRALARVVLDPGHGGRDTGAVGPAGTREKDVTLDIAHRVAPVLAAQGLQVVLTRDDDHFISLEERTARANAFGADLFVSIHCNASESHGHRGIETYVLDTTRDAIAARVAARENATTLDSSASSASSAELATILGGMRLADQSTRSTRFAQLLQRASTTAARARFGDVVDGGVHTAGFYVLVGARMPSVLFETSYISNASEEQRLASEDYRQLLADAIVNAVKAYQQGR